MIQEILLYISIFIILFSYLNIVLKFIKLRNKKIDDINSFDLAKELTLNYDEINIVESREVSISKYNLKRRVIRFTPKDYNSSNIFNLTKSALLSGYSILSSNKDKNINLLSSILPSIDYLNKSPILSLIISALAANSIDNKIAIIILVIILIYQYFINEINISSKNIVEPKLQELTKDKYNLIEDTINSYLLLNKLSFITTLILIIRAVIIILN